MSEVLFLGFIYLSLHLFSDSVAPSLQGSGGAFPFGDPGTSTPLVSACPLVGQGGEDLL